jgi:SOS-response transcriptional repressor LexA
MGKKEKGQWGGSRPGCGAKIGSGKYGKDGGKSMWIPKRLAEEEHIKENLQRLTAFLIQRNEDLGNLMDRLEEYAVKNLPSRQDRMDRKLNPIYRRYLVPVAASFEGSYVSEADDGGFEEFDFLSEFGDPDQVSILSVKGMSMIDDDIRPSDELLVEWINYPIRQPYSGDRVIAKVDDFVTVKTYKEANGKKLLVPRNKKLSPIELIPGKTSFHVYGIVRKLIRSF